MTIQETMLSLVEKCHRFYPEKHIDLSANSEYYAHRDRIDFTYNLYIEDIFVNEKFYSLEELDNFLDRDIERAGT